MKVARKRKSPIAKSLVSNSISAMIAAIELHNKPAFSYRYETVVVLLINAWELLLKAYIYKFKGKNNLFYKENGVSKSKPFLDCTGFVLGNLENKYHVVRKNLEILYEFRNNFIHYHTAEVEILIFALIQKNILFFNHFLFDFFKIDISQRDDLILLPIGFKKPLSPIDYISNDSYSANASKEAKSFIKSMIDATSELCERGLEESIFADFKINLINENRTNNADIIASIGKKDSAVNFIVEKSYKDAVYSDDPSALKVKIENPKNEKEEIALWAGLSSNDAEFSIHLPPAARLWHMYSKRKDLSLSKVHTENLIRYCLHADVPVFYWLQNFNEDQIRTLLKRTFGEQKNIFTGMRIIHICADYGRTFYEEMIKPYKKNEKRFPNISHFSEKGSKRFFQYDHIDKLRKSRSKDEYKKELELEITKRIEDKESGIPKFKDDIWNLDYYIYGCKELDGKIEKVVS